MQHTKLRFWVMKSVARKAAGDRFRAGHPKVVEVIGSRRVREIGIDHAFGEIGAITHDSVEMVFVRRVIEFGDELLVLLQGRVDRKNVNTADQGSRYHLSPFGFVAGHAGGTVTILPQY